MEDGQFPRRTKRAVHDPPFWEIEVCVHCGSNDNWRCSHGLCTIGLDGKSAEPAFELVEVVPRSRVEPL